MNTPFRIFISAPSDVMKERRRAAIVIHRLKKEFAPLLDISIALWDEDPMQGSAQTQEREHPSDSDIVVIILWSDLGTPLPSHDQPMDAPSPITETEWVFEEALRANKDRGLPDLLVYRKGWQSIPRFRNTKELASKVNQWKTLRTFWDRQRVATQSSANMFHTFDDLEAFENQLEAHLRLSLQPHIPEEAIRKQTTRGLEGSPFLGKRSFKPSQAPLFFGREQAEQEILDQWVQRAESGTAFLMLLGASGTGKSSLIQAGILPKLTYSEAISGVAWWRYASFRPDNTQKNLWTQLAQALLHQDALPELAEIEKDPAKLGEQWQTAPDLIESIFQLALQTAKSGQAPPFRHKKGCLILVVDPMEDLFTSPQITPEERETLISFLARLACSGMVWVIGAMRSDLFHHVAESPALQPLLANAGLYHLWPPRPQEMAQMIQKPAAMANIHFEVDPVSDLPLDAILLEAASKERHPLPFLASHLQALYHLDIEEAQGHMLTITSYKERMQSQSTCTQPTESTELHTPQKRRTAAETKDQPPSYTSRQAEILVQFILFDLRDRLKPLGRMDILDPATRKALDYFKQQGDASSLSQEDRRQRAVTLINLSDMLANQGHVQEAMTGYREGKALLQSLATDHPNDAYRQRDLSFIYEKFGTFLQFQDNMVEALDAFQSLLKTSERLTQLDPHNPQWQRDLWVSYNRVGEALRESGDWANALNKHRAAMKITQRLIQQDASNTQWQRDLSISHNLIGNTLQAQGMLYDALKEHRTSLQISKRLARQNPERARWQRDLSISHIKIGEILQAQGNLTEALGEYQIDLEISKRLAQQEPKNPGWQRTLAISHERIGLLLEKQGQYQEALSHFRQEIAIVEAVYASLPGQNPFQFNLKIPKKHITTLMQKLGTLGKAKNAEKKKSKK